MIAACLLSKPHLQSLANLELLGEICLYFIFLLAINNLFAKVFGSSSDRKLYILQFIYFQIQRRVWMQQRLVEVQNCTKVVMRDCISLDCVPCDPFRSTPMGLGKLEGGIKIPSIN